jgi:hypothetical protein
MKYRCVVSAALIPFACCSFSLSAASPAGQDRTPAAKSGKAAAPLRIRCELQLPDDSSGGEDTATRSVSPDEVFVSGELFRIRVTADQPGYVYILLRGSRGETQLLFPHESASIGKPVKPGEPADFPGSAWFRFDDHPGTEHVYVAFSSSRVPELDKAAASGRSNLGPKEFRTIVESLGRSASARVERLDLHHLP